MPGEANSAAAAERGRRVAVLVEYDGARFAGSQLQANAITAQSALEDAIARATGAQSRVAFAGRTDAGVHARGQVAAFDTATGLDAVTLRRALNAWLPPDVAVRAVAEVAPDFDPRRAAKRRWYRYLIDNGDARTALDRGRAWHVPGELDATAMAEAARRLVGRHDFAAFASRLEDASASTTREVYRFDVHGEAASIVIDVEANAFLPHQVRRTAGALVEVGRGKLDADAFVALLEGPPASAGPAAPPHGLYLMRVTYGTDLFGLDSRGHVC